MQISLKNVSASKMRCQSGKHKHVTKILSKSPPQNKLVVELSNNLLRLIDSRWANYFSKGGINTLLVLVMRKHQFVNKPRNSANIDSLCVCCRKFLYTISNANLKVKKTTLLDVIKCQLFAPLSCFELC